MVRIDQDNWRIINDTSLRAPGRWITILTTKQGFILVLYSPRVKYHWAFVEFYSALHALYLIVLSLLESSVWGIQPVTALDPHIPNDNLKLVNL